MKLSKSQQSVVDHLQEQIDYARTHDFIYWISKAHGYDLDKDWDAHPNPYLTNKGLLENAMRYAEEDFQGWWRKQYEKEKNGIGLCHCNSRTLYALEKMGIIKIIYDSKDGGGAGIDEVELLNY